MVKIKNRSPHAQLLKSKEGEVIQINAGTIKEVDEKFLVSYDTKVIQILSKKVIQTEVVTKESPSAEVGSPKTRVKKV